VSAGLSPLSGAELAVLTEVVREAFQALPEVNTVRPAWAYDDEVRGRLIILHPETVARLIAMALTDRP
jgi:hypothetical protein